MELKLFKASQEFDSMKKVVTSVFEAVPRLVVNNRRTLDALETFHARCLDQEKTIRRLEREKADLIKEKEASDASLKAARVKLDEEKMKTSEARREADAHRERLLTLKQVLNDNSTSFQGDTLGKLKNVVPDHIFVDFMDDAGDYNRLDTIAEIETTGSILTDLSYTRDEDDMLDDSPRGNKRNHPGKENEEPSKRRKSTTFKSLEVKAGERLVATTTVTVEPNGPCTATSTIENCPTPLGLKTGSRCPRNQYTSDSRFISGSSNGYYDPPKALGSTSSLNSQLSPSTLKDVNNRRHIFCEKSILTGDACDVCGKRFKFAVTGLKCKDCKSVVHQQCQEKLPLPCIAIAGTPSKSSKTGGIADYTPSTPPMVPALLIHCIKEIERRGLKEIGLYRVPGSDKEVRSLKEKLLRGRKVPNLADIRDVNIICGTVKAFLVDLKEPITTSIRWNEFVSAAKCANEQERIDRLTEIIGGLPQPNRHTLSYLILHLQKVASSPETLMKFDSLSKVFGPSLFGVPTKGANHSEAVDECKFANEVVFEMLNLPGEVYDTFLSEVDGPGAIEAVGLPKTPSANSLKYFMASPITVKPLKKMKYFETP